MTYKERNNRVAVWVASNVLCIALVVGAAYVSRWISIPLAAGCLAFNIWALIRISD